MTINPSLRLAGLLAILVSATACKHQNTDTPAPTPALLVTATTNPALSPTIVPLTYTSAPPTRNQPEYVFDWENAQYVPNPAGATPIPTPWNDQAKRAFSDDIRYDYKKSDGWEMVYSTFSSKAIFASPFLMLYNKYRGLLRFYFYVDGGTQNIQGNNIMIQQLTMSSPASTPSPLLNFAEESIIDLNKNALSYSTLDPQPIGDKTWYAVQAELAYDKQLAKQSYQTTGIQWFISSDKLNSVTINGGKSSTTLPVSMHVEGSSFYNNSGGTFTGTAQLLINGLQGISNLQTAGQDVNAINASLMQTTNSNLLSGIFAFPNTTATFVLPVTTSIQLSLAGRSAGVTGPSLALPGYDNSGPIGLTPQYNEAPGVFYLDNKPVITAQTSAGAYTYTLDVASVRYLFNPAVTNLADIKNIKQEIVATAIAPAQSTPSATPTLYSGTTLSANQPLTMVGVRVSFDVVPKSGATPVHIIKTFKADVKTQ